MTHIEVKMAKAISEETKIEINELYLKIGTYSGVAKIIGCAPSTVKKYIIPNFVPQEKVPKKVFQHEDLPEFSTEGLKNIENWGSLCLLNEEEKSEIRELWDELII